MHLNSNETSQLNLSNTSTSLLLLFSTHEQHYESVKVYNMLFVQYSD